MPRRKDHNRPKAPRFVDSDELIYMDSEEQINPHTEQGLAGGSSEESVRSDAAKAIDKDKNCGEAEDDQDDQEESDDDVVCAPTCRPKLRCPGCPPKPPCCPPKCPKPCPPKCPKPCPPKCPKPCPPKCPKPRCPPRCPPKCPPRCPPKKPKCPKKCPKPKPRCPKRC